MALDCLRTRAELGRISRVADSGLDKANMMVCRCEEQTEDVREQGSKIVRKRA